MIEPIGQDVGVRSRPRHVIFDLDGTLADSSAGILWSFRATLEHIGRPYDEASLRQLIGPPLGESFLMLGVEPEDIDDVVRIYRGYYAERGVHECELYDGVADTLAHMSQDGVRLSVATAKRVDFARQMLTTLGVVHFFDEIAGASLDLRVTSKFDIMSLVLNTSTVDHDGDTWMVGDRHYDMAAARAHQVSAVGALWGFGSADELRDSGAQWLATHPLELLGREEMGGSPVCLLTEVCDACGRIIDDAHSAPCRGVVSTQ